MVRQDALTRSLALKHAPAGVRFNTLRPGYVETAMTSAVAAAADISREEAIDKASKVVSQNMSCCFLRHRKHEAPQALAHETC